MVIEDLKKVFLGELLADEFIAPLSASLIYFLITMTTGWLLRTINQNISPEPIKSYIRDFSATLEMCAYFFENAFIFKHYGTFCLVLLIIAELFISNRTFLGASVSPCVPFLGYLERRVSFSKMLFRIAIHTVAGVAAYRYARLLWSWDMVLEHRDRYLETGCNSDLNVTLLVGIAVELGATLTDTWLGRQKTAKIPIVDEFIKMTLIAIMVVTGRYFLGFEAMNKQQRRGSASVGKPRMIPVSSAEGYRNHTKVVHWEQHGPNPPCSNNKKYHVIDPGEITHVECKLEAYLW